MKERTILRNGYIVETSVDASGEVTTSVETPFGAFYDDIYNVSSVGGDFRRPNPHSYTHAWANPYDVSISTESLSPPARYSRVGTDSLGGNVTRIPDTGSYNNALERVFEITRGTIDLSIDGLQWRQSVSLANSVLNFRRSVTHVLTNTIVSVAKGLKKPKNVGQRAWNHISYDKVLNSPMREIGSIWLAFQYGVRPTMDTLHELAVKGSRAAQSKMQISQGGRQYVTGSFRETQSTNTAIENGFSKNSVSSSYRCRIGGKYLPSMSATENLSQLTSLNPLSIGWELLPFSFVVDWAYDVGGYLRSLESHAISNLGQFSGWISQVEKHVNSDEVFYSGDDGLNRFGGTVKETRGHTSKRRGVLSSLPAPKPPSFEVDLGSQRLLNAAALLSQLLGAKR